MLDDFDLIVLAELVEFFGDGDIVIGEGARDFDFAFLIGMADQRKGFLIVRGPMVLPC